VSLDNKIKPELGQFTFLDLSSLMYVLDEAILGQFRLEHVPHTGNERDPYCYRLWVVGEVVQGREGFGLENPLLTKTNDHLFARAHLKRKVRSNYKNGQDYIQEHLTVAFEHYGIESSIEGFVKVPNCFVEVLAEGNRVGDLAEAKIIKKYHSRPRWDLLPKYFSFFGFGFFLPGILRGYYEPERTLETPFLQTFPVQYFLRTGQNYPGIGFLIKGDKQQPKTL
jgi:hypothetical protein